MLTLWCVLISIGSLWFVGLPIAQLLFKQKEDKETIWIAAPFIGLAVITLVLQNLVYLDVPIRYSTPWLWISVCLLWGWMVKSDQFIAIFRAIPVFVLLSALAVYIINALGLIAAGARYYVGRGWHDQFNYTATTQFLVDLPFSSSFSDITTSPYLLPAVWLKLDRIGQSVFHGFVSFTTFTDAKTTFEAVILLSPLLTLLAVYWLGKRLSLPFWPRLTAAFASGILPGLAAVHLECFFSQALCIPFLIVWPAFLSETIDRLSGRWLFASALILAVATSIYTELYIVFIATGTLMVSVKAIRCHAKALHVLLSWFILVGSALLMNSGFFSNILAIFKRISTPGVLLGIYPWAFSLEGLTRLWLGDFGANLPGWGNGFFGVVSVVWLLVAYAGIGVVIIKRKDALTFAIAALMILPLVLYFKGPQYEYQFYKLLLMISPLIPLGIALFLQEFHRMYKPWKLRMKFIVPVGVIIVIGLSGYSTGAMTLRAGMGRTLEEIGRGGAHKLLMPSTKFVQDTLLNIQNKDVYIVYDDDFHSGNFINGWLTYFSRNNRVWVANPLVGNMNLSHVKATRILFTPTDDPFMLTTSPVEMFKDYLVWSCEPYYLYEFPLNSWADVKKFIDPPKLNAVLEGFGLYDFLSLNEGTGGDSRKDAVIKVTIHAFRKISSIEVRNTNGQHSVWDTVPNNGCSLLGVASGGTPDKLINRSGGCVDIDIEDSTIFILYLADNGSIRGGRTNYQVSITFSDGKIVSAPVQGI